MAIVSTFGRLRIFYKRNTACLFRQFFRPLCYYKITEQRGGDSSLKLEKSAKYVCLTTAKIYEVKWYQLLITRAFRWIFCCQVNVLSVIDSLMKDEQNVGFTITDSYYTTNKTRIGL